MGYRIEDTEENVSAWPHEHYEKIETVTQGGGPKPATEEGNTLLVKRRR